MSGVAELILIPFLAAFLLFVFRFYNREGASSIFNPTFLCAIGSVALAGTYLVLGVFGWLPDYGTIGFGLAGLALLAVAVVRMFQI